MKSFFIFIKRFLSLGKKENFSMHRDAHYMFNTTSESEQIANSIKNLVKFDKVRTMLLPYEGQPFQKIVINQVK